MTDFRQLQRQFAAHLRNPAKRRAPTGIEPRRLKIYTELFYNNVQGFLSTAFPVLRRITPDARWHALVREFYSRHRCHTPLFHRVAGEFVQWLERRRPRPGEPDYLRELAHYEWIELELSTAPEDLATVAADPAGDLMTGRPVLSPLARLLEYRWPVHRISPDFRPRRAPGAPTWLLVHRDRRDAVHFMEPNPVTARLIQLLRPGRLTGEQALRRIARELLGKRGGQPHEAVIGQGRMLLDQLRGRDIVLGTKH